MIRRILLVAAFSVALGEAAAQETPVVRVEVSPAAVTVGESAQMRVTVLVPTWFLSPPVYPSFELSNAITRLPPDSSFPISERVGRDTWSGIVRNYRVYPMLGATYRLSGQQIRVTWANPGSDPNVTEVAVPDVEFRGVVPAGAEGLDPFLAGSRFVVNREFDDGTEGLESGDALVIRYVAELDGLPAIFIPPLAPVLDMPGVSVYADEPFIEDGETARRTEQVTLVFDNGGEVALPGLSIDWWSTESEQIETVSVPPVSIPVAGPVVVEDTVQVQPETSWRGAIAATGLAIVLFLAGRKTWPLIQARRRRARAAYERSEQFAWRQLQHAMRRGEPGDIHQCMLNWVARIAPGQDLRSFVRIYGSEELDNQLDRFIAALFSTSDDAAEQDRLAPDLAAARHACLRQHERDIQPALPPLNP